MDREAENRERKKRDKEKRRKTSEKKLLAGEKRIGNFLQKMNGNEYLVLVIALFGGSVKKKQRIADSDQRLVKTKFNWL